MLHLIKVHLYKENEKFKILIFLMLGKHFKNKISTKVGRFCSVQALI